MADIVNRDGKVKPQYTSTTPLLERQTDEVPSSVYRTIKPRRTPRTLRSTLGK